MNTTGAWEYLLEQLTIQQECLAMMATAWIADYRSHGGTVFCSRGCRECCSLTVNCTLTEAVALAQSLNEAQAKAVKEYAVMLQDKVITVSEMMDYLRMQRREMGFCPLLDADGVCSAYALRPLSCRALLSTKDSYYCGVDFANLTSIQKQEYAQSLDQSVTEYPLHYVALTSETGREMEARTLTLMQQQFGFSLYGNMPVLVYLVLEKGLADIAPMGHDAAELAISKAGFVHQFLVNFG